MGRNKYIYGLADHALVVRFTTEEGGTWAGAIERLKANGDGVPVPVFVGVEGNPTEGWERLRALGAWPFPAEAFEREGVEALRAPARVIETTPPEVRPTAPATGAPAPTTCYEACLPLILPHLRDEPGTRKLPAIARDLVVTTRQLEEWLKRAVEDGRVVRKKKGRGMVYALPALNGPSSGLFSGEDAA
jgi:predicted Rossmann fold nucleotide-binding protein DprA/Smf involved in DNA uptake